MQNAKAVKNMQLNSMVEQNRERVIKRKNHHLWMKDRGKKMLLLPQTVQQESVLL